VEFPLEADVPALTTHLIERLRAPLPGAEAQRRFAPTPSRHHWDPSSRPPGAREAAALLLIYPGTHGPSVVLTQRHADLPHHGGQISLPGGGLHDAESPEAAALREASEEIGVDPAGVRVLGTLSTLWVIVSRFVVHPVIGVIDRRPVFVPSPREVDLVIEAPIAGLRDPASLRWVRRERQGVKLWVPYFDVGGHQVWGATAMMLGEFGALLNPSFSPGPAPADRDAGPITLF